MTAEEVNTAQVVEEVVKSSENKRENLRRRGEDQIIWVGVPVS